MIKWTFLFSSDVMLTKASRNTVTLLVNALPKDFALQCNTGATQKFLG